MERLAPGKLIVCSGGGIVLCPPFPETMAVSVAFLVTYEGFFGDRLVFCAYNGEEVAYRWAGVDGAIEWLVFSREVGWPI